MGPDPKETENAEILAPRGFARSRRIVFFREKVAFSAFRGKVVFCLILNSKNVIFVFLIRQKCGAQF